MKRNRKKPDNESHTAENIIDFISVFLLGIIFYGVVIGASL